MYWVCKFCRVKMADSHRFCSKCCGRRAYAELKSPSQVKLDEKES